MVRTTEDSILSYSFNEPPMHCITCTFFSFGHAQDNGLEIFLTTGRTYLLAFDSKRVKTITISVAILWVAKQKGMYTEIHFAFPRTVKLSLTSLKGEICLVMKHHNTIISWIWQTGATDSIRISTLLKCTYLPTGFHKVNPIMSLSSAIVGIVLAPLPEKFNFRLHEVAYVG